MINRSVQHMNVQKYIPAFFSCKNLCYRSRNTTNATALEKGSIHASSKLMTWILGFVFVTVISLSSMLGLLLIPDSRNKNRVTTAVVKSPSSASSSHGQRSEMNHAGECTCHPSLLTADKRLDIHSGSACSFVALGSEGSHEEIMEQTAVTASSASSPRGTDGEPTEDRGSEGGSLVNFSVSYMHNGLEGLALGSLLASSIFHLIPHAFDLVGQGKCARRTKKNRTEQNSTEEQNRTVQNKTVSIPICSPVLRTEEKREREGLGANMIPSLHYVFVCVCLPCLWANSAEADRMVRGAGGGKENKNIT